MCCVHAPDWKGSYDCYGHLSRFIDLAKPEKLAVQGGEVLCQKETLKWLWDVKCKYNDMKFHIITNGCFSSDKLMLVYFLLKL